MTGQERSFLEAVRDGRALYPYFKEIGYGWAVQAGLVRAQSNGEGILPDFSLTEAGRQALAPRPIVAEGSVWRHHSGRLYTVLFLANNEGDSIKDKYPVTVVYQGENGRRWAGPLSDWHRRMTPA